MSDLTDMLAVLAGEKPERFPYTPMGHWNRRACVKLLPAGCFDDNIYHLPAECYDGRPRSEASRRVAVNYARFMEVSSLGVGKGGAMPFGHGGPAEIMGELVSREGDVEVWQFEGGSRRLYRFNPYSVQYGHRFPIQSPEDLDRLDLPDPRDPSRWQDVAPDAQAFTEAGVLPAAKIMGFFSGIHNNFFEFQKLMLALIDDPTFVRRLTARLAEWSLACVEEVLRRGVRLIEICDDLGTLEGLLISPEMFRDFFLPWYRRLFELCHSSGAFVHMHSHGNIAAVVPMLVEAGVDILNPFDPRENPRLEELVERFSGRVVLCGFVPSDYYLYERDEDIEALFARAAALGRKCRRGYILMEHGFPEELSPSRFRLILDLVKKYRHTS
ncbi:MAG TPA: uroporphyrinogen decarboxylase family protein [Candidatus Glassbacteria bacterium]|nr:uroporphyrinogen decarboxylase family protein [Candidatus Glassbacteria bacterium]